jgi:hypothetical protein
MVGASSLAVSEGDLLSLRLTNWKTGAETGLRHGLRVSGFSDATSTATTTDSGDGQSGGTGASGEDQHSDAEFDVQKAYAFLGSLQNGDGSWDSDLITDWSAFAYAVSGAPSGSKSKLANYLRSDKTGTDDVLEAERRAMALMALGVSPYTGTPVDYINPIVESFDGTQIGSKGIVNDDIFALFVLSHAGYKANDPMMQDIAAFIESRQLSDGSWVESADITAAAIQALAAIGDTGPATSRAEAYLRTMQGPTGGFIDQGGENGFSTAWALQAIAALGESPDLWKQGENTPLTYLVSIQDEDGGLATADPSDAQRAWATAYAIPAAEGRIWDDLMRDFSKPSGGSGGVSDETASTTATTTPTTTPDILPLTATTTAPMLATTTVASTTPQPPLSIRSAPAVVAVADEAATNTPMAQDSSALAASAIDAPGSSGIMSAIGKLIHAVLGFFTSIF